MEKRLRLAPSPTGLLHIGGARTALFAWLYSKSLGGECFLRLEDTDAERSKQEYTDSIITSFKWLGIEFDQEPVYQSKNKDNHIEKALELVEKLTAETASVFGEQLVFQSLLKSCKTQDEKKQILSSKIEEMINTVIRQISFYDFELRIHNKRRESELNTNEINKIWLKTQRESLGDAFELGHEYRNYWCYISHFIHTPFYVYSYAFGDSLVNSLFQVYKNNFPAFESKYLDLLKAGGSKNYKDLIGSFNLDASNQDFWYKGLGVIENLIDDLVNLDVEA